MTYRKRLNTHRQILSNDLDYSFFPALLLARNKPVMSQRTSKYKRFNEQNIDLTRFLKNVAVLGKITTLRNSRIFGERVYKDKFSVSFSQLLFNKSQLESYRVGKLGSQFIIKTKLIIQKSIHILKRRFLLSRQARLAGTELLLAGKGCVWFVRCQRFPRLGQSRPQSPLFFWSAPRTRTSGLIQMRPPLIGW